MEPETVPTIAESKTGDVNWSGWVFVPAGNKLTIDGSVTLTGDVNLILADGAELEITKGITSDSKTLTVYGQTNGTGKLTAKGKDGGSNEYGGNAVKANVFVYGGNATFVGGKSGSTTSSSSQDGGNGVSGNLTVGGNAQVNVTGGNSADLNKSSCTNNGGAGVAGNLTVDGNAQVNITGGAGANNTHTNGKGGDGGDAVTGSSTVTGGNATLTGGNGGAGNAAGGDGAAFSGSTMDAIVQTSTDGTTWSDWDGQTALNTYKYLKLTAAHTHSFTYSADGATITATCTEDCADYYSTPITLTLTAADAFYDGAAYDGASTDDTTVKFAETTGASIGNLTYYSLTETEEGGQKKAVETLINGAPANAGSYKVKVTVTYDTDKTVTAEKAFTINPRPVTLVAGSAEKVYDGDPLTCVTYSIEADTITAGYGFVGEEGLASVTMTSASTITNVGSTDNVIDTPTEKSNTNLANYTITTKKGTLTVKPLAETAPATGTGYTLDYSEETLKAKTGYEVSSANGDTATALTNDKVTPGSISQTFYVRKLASDTNHANSAWTAITVPARPATPAAPTLDSVTAATVVVTAVAGQVYSIDGGAHWVTGTDGKVTFTGLTAETSYSVITRKAAVTTGDNKAFASESSTALTGCTAAATPANVAATGTVSYSEETFELTDGFEISETDAPSFSAMQPTDGKVALEPGKTYYVRKAASGSVPASEAIKLVIPARPVAPDETAFTKTAETVANKKDGSFSGITEAMEYSINGGEWISGPATLTGLSNETVKVRYKATTEAFKSEEYSYIFAPSTAKLTVTMGENSVEVAYDSLVSKPADPVKSGYTFGGWYTDEAFTQAWNFGTDTVTGNMTLYPKWIKNSVQKAAITGNVTEVGTGAVSGATVELYLGTVKVAATVTDASGDYSFDNVENGVYNIVVTTADGKAKTELVTVDTANTFTKNVELPGKAVSSVVEVEDTQISDVKSDVSKTVVGGLDEIAENTDVSGTDKVTIKLTVVPKDESEVDSAEEIKKAAGSGKTVEFLDMSLWQITTTDQGSESRGNIGGNNNTLLTIVIPFDFDGVDVSSVMILRKHGQDNSEKLKKNPASGQEGFRVDQQAGTITIYAMKFSDYALAYEEESEMERILPFIFDDDKPVARMSFRDVQRGAYYYDAVKWAVENGITTGKTSTEFDPTGAVTRAQAVTFLWRAAGCPKVNYFMKFTDLKPGAYYTEAVRWAVAMGITKGVDETHFAPDVTCTRAHIVSFLYRYAKASAIKTANPFTDVKQGAYYYDAVLWAVAKDITGGKTATTFAPTDICNRAQVVTFIYRYMAK